MKLLLHACCAPCSVSCIASLQDDEMKISLFWYNPNIHPFTEYTNRRDCLMEYARSINLPVITEDRYDVKDFINALDNDFNFPERCTQCYRMRMEKAALAAKENGFDAFCTTLLISPYQNHELLKEEAERAAEKYGIFFFYRDFRPLFREGRAEARRLGMYMQKYCGCIFSADKC